MPKVRWVPSRQLARVAESDDEHESDVDYGFVRLRTQQEQSFLQRPCVRDAVVLFFSLFFLVCVLDSLMEKHGPGLPNDIRERTYNTIQHIHNHIQNHTERAIAHLVKRQHTHTHTHTHTAER